MGRGAGCGGARTSNLRTDNLHVEVRKKFLLEDTSYQMLQVVGNDQQSQRRIERWVTNMLATPSGPTKALQVLYNDGSAYELLKLLESIEEQAPDARDFVTLRDEKVQSLERLDNSGNRYFKGNLRNKDGLITAKLGKVTLTAEGKMQLFLNGNGHLEIALRNVVAKRWIEKLVHMEQDEKKLRDKYNKKLEEERNRCTQTFNDQLTHMVESGMSESSARGALRATAQPLYGGLLKPVGLKSGIDAVLLDQGKLTEEDAKLCAQKREDEVSIGKEELKKRRSTVKCVSKEGTRILHSRMEDMRFQALRLMINDPSMTPYKAHKIVGEQCEKDKTFVFKNQAGEEESAAEHARCYFSKAYDKEIFRLENRDQIGPPSPSAAGMAAPGALLPAPSTAPPLPPANIIAPRTDGPGQSAVLDGGLGGRTRVQGAKCHLQPPVGTAYPVQHSGSSSSSSASGSVSADLGLGAAAAARPKGRYTSESHEAERARQRKEKKTLQEKLNEQGLRLVKIKADGHCLFSAINDQLKRSAPHERNRQQTYKTLRRAAADFMLQVREVVCLCI